MTIRFIGPLLCGGLLLIATSVFAGDPIPGVGVEGGKNPGSQKMTKSGNTGTPTKNYNIINTTRSNIKHGVAARAAPLEDRGRLKASGDTGAQKNGVALGGMNPTSDTGARFGR
jgi:hypothetical protein